MVDLDWLAKAATTPGLRVLDVSPLHIWRAGHIDAARHAWWRDTVDPNYPVFGAVLPPGDDQADRQRLLDSLDLTANGTVVVYDNERGVRAARLVWFLRFIGFDRAALLNARFADWRSAPFSIESIPGNGPAPLVAPREGFYLVTEQLLDLLRSPELQLVDIRTGAEQTDDFDGQMPTGRIPGSLHLPWTALFDESGHVLPADRIRQLSRAAGIGSDRPTVLYGRFGVDTALPWLALRDTGLTDVQIYDRGWAEWSVTPDLPREPLV